VLESLASLELEGKRVGVQLYGSDPNDQLMSYLASRGVTPDCVAPYVYASATEDQKVIELIERMGNGGIDAIAFTSKAQVERLRKLARQRGLEKALDIALATTIVAAIGPIVAEELVNAGVRVDVMPDRTFYMKPLVSELARVLDLGPA
jgi:uroporphyrinogen-III synthase